MLTRVLTTGCLVLGLSLSAAPAAEEKAADRKAPAEPMAPAGVPAPAPPLPGDLAKRAVPEKDRIAPERMQPIPIEKVTEETKKEVTRLVDQYFKALEPGEQTPEVRAKVEKAVKDLGASEWAVREAASKDVLKLGRPAVGALRDALKSGDAEVVQRASDALKAIEGEIAKPITDALKLYPQTVWVVIQGDIDATRDKWTKAKVAAAEAEKAGKKDEAAALQTDVRRLGQRISDLDRLYWIVQNYTRYDR